MLGSNPTGLGMFSSYCLNGLAERYELDLIAGTSPLPVGNIVARAPASVALDAGKWASLRRYFWSRSLCFDAKNHVVYSPTHHGLPNQSGQIVTIHDLIHLRYPNQYPHIYAYFHFILPRIMKKCRAVITVSETTRYDIAQTFDYPLERIFVVPNGVDSTVFTANPLIRPISPYLLMVGGRHPHKNVMEALDMAVVWKNDYRLIITSCNHGNYRKKLEDKVDELKLRDQVEFKGYLSHDELLHLYQGASALIYPSRWEGFGIPPLEAFACGTPVIASDIPVHREVLGDAAIFVKLEDVESWGNAFHILAQPKLIKTRMDAAQKRLEKFTWSNAVDALERALLHVEPRLEELRR
jgi:glycosyltransferase involved in cell wall biosynthesis